VAQETVAHSLDEDLSDVRSVGGWAAILVALLVAPEAALTYVAGAVSGHPELDGEGLKLLVSALVLTGPFSIAIGLIVLAMLRGWFPSSRSSRIGIVGALLVAGLFLGNLLYGVAGIPLQVVLDTGELGRVLAKQTGNLEMKLLAAIFSIVAGYFFLYGPAYFSAALVSGTFAGYAASKLLFRRRA